ncbi:MAG: hypothetical protein LBH85_01615 [Treponema sp.]|jgi:hypothetical protein|nr:hypothetical protein [Treponema sp.]
MNKKLIGNKAYIFFDTYDPTRIVHGDGTTTVSMPKTWYYVVGRGESASGVPAGFDIGSIFRAPKTGATPLTFKIGDRVMPIDPQRFCKTSADYSIEQGTIDVGDDCEPGASILDGIIKISGSFSGFFQEDIETGEFTDITLEILNRYLAIASDDGSGAYAITEQTADIMFLMILLNNDVKSGQMEKWLLTPIILPSMSSSIGMSDAQNMDISWQQGEGRPLIYHVPRD